MPLAPSKSAWLTAVETDPRILAMRADRRRNVLAAARILGWTSRDGTTRPTRSRTAARMGVTERTVSKIWRVLEQLGYLACTENGTSAQYRPSWAQAEGNLARCWALVLPDEKNGPRSGDRGREVPHRIIGPGPALTSHRTPDESSSRRGSLVEVGKSPRSVCPQPKKLTDEGWRRESARFVRAGWSVRDLQEATEAKPDGTRWAFTGQPRFPRSWLRWRLSFWLGPDGPLESPSQRRAAVSVDLRAAQDRRRAERKVGTAPPAVWYQAREAMAARA